MPASLRVHGPRGSSSRPYDCRSLTAGPLQSESPLVSSQSPPPTSPIQDLETPPDHPGLPTYAEYKRIEAGYLASLSPRKRDKALITQAMFDKIWDVLHQPEACTIETPQFRFWVRKMFTLSRWSEHSGWTGTALADPDSDDDDASSLALERAMGIGHGFSGPPSAVILHEHRPVAIMEQLYELFCYCHVRAGHGGRDKTCAVIRQHYSWVPKELTAQFVKACPTCASKRSGGVIGMDVGMTVTVGHARTGYRRGNPKRGRGIETGTPEVSLSMGWLTTGGPLDPGNPEPCGVRERLRAREEARSVGSSSSPVPVSPRNDATSVTHEVPLERRFSNEWRDAPGALPVDMSPRCDAMQSVFPQVFAIDNDTAMSSPRQDQSGGTSSPNDLPSLVTALSNDSLDAPFTHLNGGDHSTTGECLPPALRPLRLFGPVSSGADTEPDAPRSLPCPFQIDPILLSFDYPGTELSGGLFKLSDASGDETGPVMSMSGVRPLALHGQTDTRPDATSDASGSPGVYSFRSPIMDSEIQNVLRMDALDTLVDACPGSTERSSTVPLTRSRCHGSRYAPLAMLLPCSDGQLDAGTLSSSDA